MKRGGREVGAHRPPRRERRRGVAAALGWSAALVALAGCHANHPQSSLHPASPEAAQIARLWWWMFGVLAASFVLVMALAWRAVRGPRREAREARPPGGPARFVVVGGIVFPAVVLVWMLFYSLHVTMTQRRPSVGTRIEVVGHQWWWEVRYPESGGVTANEIYLPVGEPVLLEVWASDVVHSFWVPNLHGKIDMMPEVKNRFWLQADEAGVWRGVCAEFCGRQHALMAFTVHAVPPAEFEAWLRARAPDGEPEPVSSEEVDTDEWLRGRDVFFEASCHACHAVRGTEAVATVGPDLTHLASRATLGAGAVANTPEALAKWIVSPQAVKPGNLMPGTELSAEDLAALVVYLGTLR